MSDLVILWCMRGVAPIMGENVAYTCCGAGRQTSFQYFFGSSHERTALHRDATKWTRTKAIAISNMKTTILKLMSCLAMLRKMLQMTLSAN